MLIKKGRRKGSHPDTGQKILEKGGREENEKLKKEAAGTWEQIQQTLRSNRRSHRNCDRKR
jgi:hypothetical protein